MTHYFSLTLHTKSLLDALVVEVPRGQTIGSVIERLYKSNSKTLMEADALIVRPSVDTPIDPAYFDKLSANRLRRLPSCLDFLGVAVSGIGKMLKRADKRPVYILYSYCYRLYLSCNINNISDFEIMREDEDTEKIISAIMTAEMDYIVSIGAARMPEIPETYYFTPASTGQNAFLRVGNIQGSQAAIDGIFFWLIPSLEGCRGIVCETWSIASVALNISRRLLSYRKDRRPCPIEMMSNYIPDSLTALDEIGEMIQGLVTVIEKSVDSGYHILFLQSAVSTGTLQGRLLKALHLRNIPEKLVRFVALFNLGLDTEIPSLRNFTGESNEAYRPLSEEEMEGRDRVAIDPHTYFVSQYKDIEKTLTIGSVSEIASFISRYSEGKVESPFRLHKNDVESQDRHHAIWINTLDVIKRDAFGETFCTKVSALAPPPEIILTPGHQAARRLAEMALLTLAELGVSARHIIHEDIDLDLSVESDNLVATNIDNISSKGSLLILDDCFISGLRLRTYQKHMRRRAFTGPIHYLVAIARPDKDEAWSKAQRMLRYPHNTVQCVEKILLPDLDEGLCPWCQEHKGYQSLSDTQPINAMPSAIVQRKKFLEDGAIEGLKDSIFVHPDGVSKLDFQKGSLFGEEYVDDVTLFAAVVSSIQTLRSKPENLTTLGPRHYPVCTVLKYRDYLIETFNESRLRACIIRSLRSYEMVYTAVEAETARAKAAIDICLSEKSSENDLTIEMLFAYNSGKFPLLNTELMLVALERLGVLDTYRAMFKF